MKRLKFLLCVLCLMAAMSALAFAGDMDMPGKNPPPPDQGRMAVNLPASSGLSLSDPFLTVTTFNCLMTISAIL